MTAYSVSGYNKMIVDRVRSDAYSRALRAVIQPDSIVADIGTGSGYFAVLACKLGAAKVYAIEPDHVIEVAKEAATKNGCADRIEFFQEISTAVTLPQKADVVISDLRGVLPLFGNNLPSIIDARQRLLAPGGSLIAARDDLYARFVNSPRLYSEYQEAGSGGQDEPDFSLIRQTLRSQWSKARVREDECIGAPLHLGTLDYMSVESATFHSGVSWEAPISTTTHGLCIWFDATLTDGIGFSNAPSAPELIYGQAFLPFAEPLELEPGDETTVSLDAFLGGDEYQWRWETTVRSGHDPSLTRTHFKQSTLDGTVVARERLRRRRNDYVPEPTQNQDLFRFVLERIDGNHSLDTIARDLAASYPARFREWTQALAFAGEVVEKSR